MMLGGSACHETLVIKSHSRDPALPQEWWDGCEVYARAERQHVQGVTEALEVDTATLSKVLGKAMSAWRAAEAAKKARELVRRKSVLTKSTLPGKLADCTTNNKAESEIFVVEGDSAGVHHCPAADGHAGKRTGTLACQG